MRGRDPRRHIALKDFSAIGNAISFAIGAAAAHRDGKIMLIEGDGSFLMHIQELETVRRHKLKILFVIMNDGAYGAEIHKLRAEGLDDSGAVFGRPDFAAIANGFGLSGATVTSVDQFADLYRSYEEGDRAAIWNVRISDKVISSRMRSGVQRGHGKL
jgi:thiamine pyrophosphate-dependent acetolactate synthase large subunit-like protein